MELYLKNIGKIGEAAITLDGITVIAGENDTGKSTISRVLFSIFSSCFDIEERIISEKINVVEEIIRSVFRKRSILWGDINDVTRRMISVASECNNNLDALAGFIKMELRHMVDLARENGLSNDLSDEKIDNVTEEIINYLNVSDETFFDALLKRTLDEEFNGQIQNIYTKADGKIRLKAGNIEMSILITENTIDRSGSYIDLHSNIFYLDNPMILDDLMNYYYTGKCHQGHLCTCLVKGKRGNIVGEIVANKKLERIFSMLSSVCSGDMTQINSLECGYQDGDGKSTINLKNLSAGLKTFIILKTLLLNGEIEYGSVILLDEPEIHLHPEWQLIFAEIIVLLQKEFNVFILLNTHSHYFLDAIEVYSRKHGVADKCRYYLSDSKDGVAFMTDVTGNTEQIYKKLARPLQTLENERYRDED